jgi:hypothetical protein
MHATGERGLAGEAEALPVAALGACFRDEQGRELDPGARHEALAARGSSEMTGPALERSLESGLFAPVIRHGSSSLEGN